MQGGRAPLNLKGKWQVVKAALGQVPLAPFMVGSSFFRLSLSPVFVVVVAVVFLGSGLLHYHSTHHLLSMLLASVDLYLSGTKGT